MYSALTGTIDDNEREQLILEHLPQVRLIARRIHERLPENVSMEDLVSSGVIGLISAIDNFDRSQNVKLKTYAEYKIRGAILDSLRGLDWAPRQKRHRAKQVESAIATAEQRLKRCPTEGDVAAELKIPLQEYHEWLLDVRGLNIASLEFVSGEQGKNMLHYVAEKDDNLPSTLLERSELEQLLADAIREIPAMEQTVLSLYYQEDLTLREIAEIVHLHESRISQLKTQAVLRLRAHLSERWPATRGLALA